MMKKVRLVFVFLCVLVMMTGAMTIAAADSRTALHMKEAASSKAIGYEQQFYILKNGKTVSFYVMADYMSSLYPASAADDHDDFFGYTDILFDCDGKVTAKTSASWVTITNSAGGPILQYTANNTQKNRTATISFSGKKFSAKIKLIQVGKNAITKAIRKGKTVTVNFKLAKSAVDGSLYISWYRNEDGIDVNYGRSIPLKKGQTKATFTVESGWSYYVSVSGTYKFGKSKTITNNTDWIYFDTDASNINDTVQLR